MDLVGIPNLKRMDVQQCFSKKVQEFIQFLNVSVQALCTITNCAIGECKVTTTNPVQSITEKLTQIIIYTLPTPPQRGAASINSIKIGVISFFIIWKVFFCYKIFVTIKFKFHLCFE